MSGHASLKDRVVLITGGGRGLGRVMALGLLARDARVMITASRTPDDLAAVMEAAKMLAPGACRATIADVSDPASARRAVEETVAAFGRIDVLVNNAARAPYDAAPRRDPKVSPKFWEADAAGYERMLRTNIAGPFLMAQAAAPLMVVQGFGRIVNISTSRPTMLYQGGGPYGPAKAALEASSVIWARDLEGTGVTVNVLLPGGAADTALIPGHGLGARASAAFRAGKGPPGLEGQPLGDGLLPPEVMVPPMVWLASDESAAHTGRRIVARDWDPDLAPDEAARRAMQPRAAMPTIM